MPGQQQLPVGEPVSIEVPPPDVQEHAVEAATVLVTPAREASIEIVSEVARETAPVHLEPVHHAAQVDISPAAAPMPSFELPPDLVQVETAPGRAAQGVEAEQAAGVTQIDERPRRPRPPEEPVASEPLVQIETRH